MAHAQLTITGITRDSVTLEPLPFVSIQVAGKARAMSNIDGKFTFTCHIGDSSAYTHMGYRKKFKVHFKNEISLTVLLGESVHLLKSVTFIDNYKPQGSENWKDAVQFYKSPFKNPVGTDPNAVQTFGVGGSISGALSYFSKSEKDRRKYQKVVEDQNATATYREVLASDEVKQDLMKMYSFTEAEYYKKIEKFNIQYPQAAYIKDRNEVINRLIQFFAIKEK
jgi:hypothetical protein